MKHEFSKRIFTAELFINDIVYLVGNTSNYLSLSKNGLINTQFTEKINNIISAVNGCMYCSWFHAKQAMNSGISEEEIKNMMHLQFQADATEFELVALLYAQHYAETNRHPDADMTKKLYDKYGAKTAKHIILIIRRIYFGNLYGNTWEAVIGRLNGNPAPNSNIIFEAIFFVLSFWFMIPITFIMNYDKNKSKF